MSNTVIRILAVDPGKDRSGWALFQGERPTDPSSKRPRLHSCGFDGPRIIRDVSILVVEIPVVRRAGKSKGDPGDLIQVALSAGLWIGLHYPCEIRQYKPETWKGQVPKSVVHERALAVLDAEERGRVPALPGSDRANDANTWDAVALGLFHLGRLR